jgi:Uma2 family endonuclease
MATKTLMTVEEFFRLREQADTRYELADGELIAVPRTTPEHSHVAETLLVALRNFLAQRGTGQVWSEQPFQLSGDTVRIPDISVVRANRTIAPGQIPEGAPELAVEIESPERAVREHFRRLGDYFAAGCKRVWMVYPEHGEVYMHGLAGVTRRRGDEALEDSELLPGFSVKVSSLFEQP